MSKALVGTLLLAHGIAQSTTTVIVQWSNEALAKSITAESVTASDVDIQKFLSGFPSRRQNSGITMSAEDVEEIDTAVNMRQAITDVFNGRIVSNVSLATLPALASFASSSIEASTPAIQSIRRMNALALDFIEVADEASAAALVAQLNSHPDVLLAAVDSAVVSSVAPVDTTAQVVTEDADAEEGIKAAAVPAGYKTKDPQVMYGVNTHQVSSVWASRQTRRKNPPKPFRKEHSVIVSVQDNSFALTHADLKDALWTNEGEIPGNGIDDDNNGYVDDVHGWNVMMSNGDVGNVGSSADHGSHCAGIIAATANNNEGIAGVGAFGAVKLMGVPFMGSDPKYRKTVTRAMEAFNYSIGMGAEITSNSWAIDPEYQVDSDSKLYLMLKNILIDSSKSVSHFIASGNEKSSLDTYKPFPSSWAADLVNSYAVCASGKNNEFVARFSNYSPTRVELCASGDGVMSTTVPDAYGAKSGTSMSTPTAAGIAGLVLASVKEAGYSLTPKELKAILTSPEATLVDPAFKLINSASGPMDAYGAVQAALKYVKEKNAAAAAITAERI